MLRQIVFIASIALAAPLAVAAEAGKIIFAAGKAAVADRPAAEGARVQEGEMLTTGADGFIYVKTIDNGLFILRPNTKARIVSYHIDAANPANTRIKLDLISGVARSRSGQAVKVARQNFRFNTPVAAIGVRGTDFTVFTDNDTSRVAVISGGVVVSGFAGACSPEGIGPCEGAASRELSAAQRGQLLQVKRGAPAPELLQGGVLAPDLAPPAQVNSAASKASSADVGLPVVAAPQNLDPQKSESLVQLPATGPVPEPTPTPTPTPVPEAPINMPPPAIGGNTPDPAPPVVEAVPERTIVWGRWQRVLGKTPKINLTKQQGISQLVAVNGNYALFRTPGKDYVPLDSGKIGFKLQESEAFVYKDIGNNRVVTPATITNGALNLDFGAKTFTTSLDMKSNAETFAFQAQGTMSRDGLLHGDQSLSRPGYIDLQGALSSEQGGSAAYIFSGRLDDSRSVNGVTFWRK